MIISTPPSYFFPEVLQTKEVERPYRRPWLTTGTPRKLPSNHRQYEHGVQTRRGSH